MTTQVHPDGLASDILATDIPDVNTMRGMGLVPVNPPKATSVVGLSPYREDEFLVTRLAISRPDRSRKSPDDRDSKNRGGTPYIAR